MEMQAIMPGRYVLDAAGVLHPLGAADPVCIVTVRAKLSDLPDAVPTARRRRGGPAKVERNAAIVAAYQAGRNSPGLAREFGVSIRRICQIVEAAGVKLRPRGHHNPKRNCRREGEMADSRRGHEGSAAGREAKAVAPVPSGALRREDDTPANAGQACTRYHAKAGGEAAGGGRPEPAVEPVSRAAAGRSAAATSELMDVTAGETAPVAPAPFVPGAKIDLSTVKSAMDRRAETVEAMRMSALQRGRELLAGKSVLCRCGGTGVGTVGPVPAWFGNDCIEGDCELKRVDRADVRASRSMPPVSGVSA